MSRLAGTLFFLLIILLHLGTGTFAINAKSGKKTKVLILGAGVSGIIAAKTLADKNIADFIVLEGQDYVGGRVKHVPFGGYNIEAGANWIHYAEDEETEPIWKLKNQMNITGIWSNYSDIVIR